MRKCSNFGKRKNLKISGFFLMIKNFKKYKLYTKKKTKTRLSKFKCIYRILIILILVERRFVFIFNSSC